jgi:hypothetical protein
MTRDPGRDKEIRRRAHQLAAAGLRAALNMWELDLYYPEQADQDRLEYELLRIIHRLDKQGGAA